MTMRNSPAAIGIAWSARAIIVIQRFFSEAANELARINRAGLSADAFAGKSRGDRARIVAASLSHRHKGHHRCC